MGTDGELLQTLWDFDDAPGSEARFRELAASAADEVGRELALTQVARALGLQGRFEEGYAVLLTLGAEHPEVAVRAELEHGRLLRSGGDPEAARPRFVRAARLAQEAALDHLHVDALHMLALVAPAEQQLDATLVALEAARSSTQPRGRAWEASVLNNLGMVHADAGDFAAALPVFEEALALREREGDPERTRIARWMVAWALRHVGATDRAREIQLGLREELLAAGRTDIYVSEELTLLGVPPSSTQPPSTPSSSQPSSPPPSSA